MISSESDSGVCHGLTTRYTTRKPRELPSVGNWLRLVEEWITAGIVSGWAVNPLACSTIPAGDSLSRVFYEMNEENSIRTMGVSKSGSKVARTETVASGSMTIISGNSMNEAKAGVSFSE